MSDSEFDGLFSDRVDSPVEDDPIALFDSPVGLVETQLVDTVLEDKPRIVAQELAILRYCEQVFWETGLVPSQDRLIEDLTPIFMNGWEDVDRGYIIGTLNQEWNLNRKAEPKTVELHAQAKAVAETKKWVSKAFKNEAFLNALRSKGLDLTPVKAKKTLTAAQLALSNMLLNNMDKRSVREKLAQLNVTQQQYNAWLRDPVYQEHLRRRGEALLGSSDYIAYKNLVAAVESKDLNAIKLFMEVRGIYNPRLQIDINIEVVITRILDIVSRHVEPAKLQLIAAELDGVMEETG